MEELLREVVDAAGEVYEDVLNGAGGDVATALNAVLTRREEQAKSKKVADGGGGGGGGGGGEGRGGKKKPASMGRGASPTSKSKSAAPSTMKRHRQSSLEMFLTKEVKREKREGAFLEGGSKEVHSGPRKTGSDVDLGLTQTSSEATDEAGQSMEKQVQIIHQGKSDSKFIDDEEGHAFMDKVIAEKATDNRVLNPSVEGDNLNSLEARGSSQLIAMVEEAPSAEDVQQSFPKDPFPAQLDRPESDSMMSLTAAERPETKLKKEPPVGEAYNPLEDAWWENNEPTPYLHLAKTFELVSKTTKRIRTVELLSDMMRSIIRRRKEDLLETLYLCSSRLAPPWEGIELGLGGRALGQALREATGASRNAISQAYVRLGDMGDIAQELKMGVRTITAPKRLTVSHVYKILRQVAEDKGNGSTARKKLLVKKLFVACRDVEIRWITRTLVQNLRIGAVVKTILVSLGRAIALERGEENLVDQATSAIVEAFSRCSSFDVLTPLLLGEKSWNDCLEGIPAQPGIPMKPQLGRITRDPEALLKRFSGVPVSCEYKYDGQRAQIHYLESGAVRIFSRHLENVTSRYLETVVPLMKEITSPSSVKSAILDAEIVAVDRSDGTKLLPFQTLAARTKKVDVCVMVFDLLYLDGESLMKNSLSNRKQFLLDRFSFPKGKFEMVEARSVSTAEQVMDWLQGAVREGAEGLMCKTLEGPLSTYEPALRSEGWAKIKKDYVEGLSGSLDLVPIAAWWGNGRKAGWFSPFLLACYHDGEFQSLCKVMSGYSDQQYRELTKFYKDGRLLDQKPANYVVDAVLSPSVWLQACHVWEIKGADFTISPVHSAAFGMVQPDKGISLRFPRFVNMREDKEIEDATSAEEIADMYSSQSLLNPEKRVHETPEAEDDHEEDGSDSGNGESDEKLKTNDQPDIDH